MTCVIKNITEEKIKNSLITALRVLFLRSIVHYNELFKFINESNNKVYVEYSFGSFSRNALLKK